MNFEDCLKLGLIRKKEDVKRRVSNEIEKAQRFLQSAKRNFTEGDMEAAYILAYLASFRALRALLYSKGYDESSHICLVKALEKLFNRDNDLLSLLSRFDDLRLIRHSVQYRNKVPSTNEVKFAVKLAELVLEAAEKRLWNRNK